MENNIPLPYWAIIPAAGVGSRMQSSTPKQYLPLAGRTIIQHSLDIFIQHPCIQGIVLSISEGDSYWAELETEIINNSKKPILIAKGGKQRSDSVLSALLLLQQTLQQKAQTDAWVFVHDAARPCLLATDIDKLIQQLDFTQIGVLLGLPVYDTLKRCNSLQQVETTICREFMWRALTPQVFKLLTLIKALQLARTHPPDIAITDESSVIELLGLKPTIIAGDSNNIKITRPEDLAQAEQFLHTLTNL